MSCHQGMNCEKNAVVCEGYPEKQIWKSGREKMEEGESLCSTTIPLPPCSSIRPPYANT